MTRSLFFAFFVRLAFAMALIIAVRVWLVPHNRLLSALLVLAWASVSAYLLTSSLRASIVPLQTAAIAIGSHQAAPPDGPAGTLSANLAERILDQRFSDFDELAHAVARASREVQRALNQSAASRHELEAMIDSLQDAVVAVDPSGRIQWSNQRMERLTPSWTGVASSKTVRIGQALVHTVRDPEVLECVRFAIDQRAFCQRRSTSLVPGRIFEVNASPMPSGGAVALIHDITRIEQVERTQREFVANVSHELRTPLTSISGYVETLLDHETSLSPQARGFLTTILKNATRMNRLTEDLLTMAQVESAEQKLRPAPLSAASLVRDTVASMSGLVADADAVLEIAEICPADVLVDPDSAHQVLANLIENAVKYGKDRVTGIAHIVVGARPVSEPTPAVEFSVRDSGPGIASEHLPRLFERFYRVDKARSLESGGTGLGLAIARHIVEAQGGSIRAESEINRGSNFLFTLPLSQAGLQGREVSDTTGAGLISP